MTFNGQLIRLLLCACLLVVLVPPAALARQAALGSIEGAVTDAAGAAVAGARVYLIDPHQVLLKTTQTDGEGRFRFEGVQAGSYVVRVAMKGFAGRRVTAQVGRGGATPVAVALDAETLQEHVTVTAEAGQALDPSGVAQRVNVIPEDRILLRAKAVLSQVGREEPGLELQRTSPTMAPSSSAA